MNYKLEVIGFNIEACLLAQFAGAHRIELCDSPGEGGTTPSYGFIKKAREKLQIELYPIIRPRGGDFLYTDEEFDIMKADVQICKELGCNGVVIGMLNADGSVDKERCLQLVENAFPMHTSFHRAFDRTNDACKALEDIIEIGCKRILTSGLRPTAMEGIDTITELVKQANGRITIMPGSGVRAENVVEIAERTKAVEFHSSARINMASNMTYVNEQMKEDQVSVSVDVTEIRKIITSLNNSFTAGKRLS